MTPFGTYLNLFALAQIIGQLSLLPWEVIMIRQGKRKKGDTTDHKIKRYAALAEQVVG